MLTVFVDVRREIHDHGDLEAASHNIKVVDEIFEFPLVFFASG